MKNLVAKRPEVVTSAMILHKVKELIGKQVRERPISLDSLALFFGIKSVDIIHLVKELEDEGLLLHQIPATVNKRAANMGTVILSLNT